MIALSYYLLITAGYMLAFWCLYLLFFRNKFSHAISRGWLLLSVMVPLVLPAIHLSMPRKLALPAPVLVLPEVVVGGSISSSKASGPAPQSLSIEGLLMIVYCIIAAWFLLRIIVSYYRVHQILHTGKRQQVGGKPVYTQTNIGPGSMGRAIFFPTDEINAQMLQHELAHVRLKHSADLLLLQLISALFWPNILIRIILKELRTVHEFQADAYAGSANGTDYSLLLLNVTLNTNQFSTIHTFHQPPLKRRITMLQNTNNRLKKGSIIGAILLAAVFAGVALWMHQAAKSKSSAITALAKEPDTRTPDLGSKLLRQSDGKAVSFASEMPQFNGNLNSWLNEHLKWPEKARKAGAHGLTWVSVIVTDKGSIDVQKIAHSSGNAELDSAYVAVLKEMPAWKPAMQDGKPVNMNMILTMNWKLGLEAGDLFNMVNGKYEYNTYPSAGK